jgi:hypothetical protein
MADLPYFWHFVPCVFPCPDTHQDHWCGADRRAESAAVHYPATF